MATEVPPADPLQSVFDHLEAEKTLIANLTLTWKNLADHFSSLEQTLADRSLALDSKIEELDAETAKTLESLDLREASIPDRESAATALIEERKNSSVSELEDAEAKLPEDLKGFLRFYCRSMDSSGLWRFVLSRRKDLAVRRHEITDAVGLAVDPARLVLDAVQDFLAQPTGEGTWALGMLISSLFDSDGKKAPEVSDGIREKAAGVTAAMKAKLEGKEEEGGGGAGFADAQMFLQMVVVFGLGSKFEEEFLRKLVIEHASRKEMAKLAAGLGFGEKLADIIDVLVKSNKQIEAVYFAHEAGLMEQFSPTLLLKTCLQTSRTLSPTSTMAARSLLLHTLFPQIPTTVSSKPKTLTLALSISPSSRPSVALSLSRRARSSGVVRHVAVSSDFEQQQHEEVEEANFSPDLKLFVGNLPFDVDSSELADLFMSAGTVEMVEVIYDKLTGKSRGFGFVTMSTVEEVKAAAQQFNGHEISGRALRVNSGPPPRRDELPREFRGGGGNFGSSNRVYVGNLSWNVDNAALETLFSEQGRVLDAKVVYDRDSGRSRGFGFITYGSPDEVNNAVSSLDGTDLDGRRIRVTVAEERERPRRQF